MNMKSVRSSLLERGYTVTCFETAAEAAEYLNTVIDGKSVGFGGSVTLQQMGIYEMLASHNLTYSHWRLEDGESAADTQKRAQDAGHCFAIELKESGKVIGEMEAHPESAAPDEGAAKDTFSPCWMLNPAYHGKGYAYEAAHAFFDYLFHEKGARRIYAYTEDYNIPCQRLCEKLGMRREGLFMEFVTFVNNPDGTPLYENTMQYAILKREWDAASAR